MYIFINKFFSLDGKFERIRDQSKSGMREKEKEKIILFY